MLHKYSLPSLSPDWDSRQFLHPSNQQTTERNNEYQNLPKYSKMAVQSCLVLIEDSRATRPSGYTIEVPDDRNAQVLVENIRRTLMENTSKTRSFFNSYVFFQKPTVSIATLRSVSFSPPHASGLFVFNLTESLNPD